MNIIPKLAHFCLENFQYTLTRAQPDSLFDYQLVEQFIHNKRKTGLHRFIKPLCSAQNPLILQKQLARSIHTYIQAAFSLCIHIYNRYNPPNPSHPLNKKQLKLTKIEQNTIKQVAYTIALTIAHHQIQHYLNSQKNYLRFNTVLIDQDIAKYLTPDNYQKIQEIKQRFSQNLATISALAYLMYFHSINAAIILANRYIQYSLNRKINRNFDL